MFLFLKKNLSKILFSISLILIFYTYLQSEIINNGINRDYYKIYYLFSLIILIISFLSFYFNDKFKEYFLIIFISFLLSFYLFETYITLSIYKNTPKKINKFTEFKKIYGLDFDKRSRLQIYEDLKKKDINSVVKVEP